MEFRIIDILRYEKEGESRIIYVPKYIMDDIQSIAPHIGSNGVLFKNVSNIETHSNKCYTVIGNYIKLSETLIKMRTTKGYKG